MAIVTLNRPEARNALSDRLTPALRQMIHRCAQDPQIGALLITGSGATFCAGGDIKGMGGAADARRLSFEERVADLKQKQRTRGTDRRGSPRGDRPRHGCGPRRVASGRGFHTCQIARRRTARCLSLMKDNLDDALAVDFLSSLDREAERMMRAAETEDHREAVQAFREKRPAVFTGR